MEDIRIDNISIKVTPDEFHQDDADGEPIEYPVGVSAEAEVSYLTGAGGRRTEHLSSSGIWGVEGGDTDYIKDELAQEEIDDLQGHLEAFGVNMIGFDIASRLAIAKLP